MLTTTRLICGTTIDDEKNKPALHKFYDFTKGGTDIVDQKIGGYTRKAKSPKWKMVALYYILDTARINSITLSSLNNDVEPRSVASFKAGWDFANALVLPHINSRSRNGLSKSILSKIDFITGVKVVTVQEPRDDLLPKLSDSKHLSLTSERIIDRPILLLERFE